MKNIKNCVFFLSTIVFVFIFLNFFHVTQTFAVTTYGTCTGTGGQQGICYAGSMPSGDVTFYQETTPNNQCGINGTKDNIGRNTAVYCCKVKTSPGYGTCTGATQGYCTTSTSNKCSVPVSSGGNNYYTGYTAKSQCGINGTKANLRNTVMYCACNPAKQKCPTPPPPPSGSPTPSPSQNATSLVVVLGLPGIGFNGNAPQHTTRNITVELYAPSVTNPGGPGTNPLNSATSIATYDSGSDNNAGYFVTTTPISFSHFTSGDYQILIKTQQYLYKLAVNAQNTDNPHVFTLNTGTSTKLDPLIMAAGDVALPGGQVNFLNLNDYNVLISCYGANAGSANCPVNPPSSGGLNLADLNDDGQVTIVDLNIFLRSLFALQQAGAPGCSQGDCQGD